MLIRLLVFAKVYILQCSMVTAFVSQVALDINLIVFVTEVGKMGLVGNQA